ncbi:MAG: hypothetical protein FJ356_01715 [Thaumarchaeota archaeon]|nr:hypothetical protein [Nitrososphaerota archaeon]
MNLKKSIVTKKRRAVSQVIGALFALAIVATFGSVLLIQGVQGVENFTAFLNIFEQTEAKSAQEVFIIEHVKFNATATGDNHVEIDVWVRNTGKIDIIVDKISIVKINTQELIANAEGINKNIFQKEVVRIGFTSANVTMPTVSPCPCTDWEDVFVAEGSTEYRVTVTTIRDKSVETVAGLFNS